MLGASVTLLACAIRVVVAGAGEFGRWASNDIMERDKKSSLNRGCRYSSFSGVIIALGLALYLLISSHAEWEAFGAGLLAGGLLVVGPVVGYCFSVILANLVYVPLYLVSRRVTQLPILILPNIGAIVGLILAFAFSLWWGDLIFPVYLVFAVWGAIGGFLFVSGAEHRKVE